MAALFSSIDIRDFHFRNRVVMPPMVRELADESGCVTEAVLDNYSRPARAGTGLIIVEATAIEEAGRCWKGGLCAYGERHLPGLIQLAERIHAEGAVAGIQLVHGGPQASPHVSGHETVGPSAVRPSEDATVPCALTIAELEEIQDNFAASAALVVEAGFDMVEIHGAHGYLLDSFLMMERNRRADEYGGSLAGRMRMLAETCRRVRDRVGDRPLVTARVSFFNKTPAEITRENLQTLVGGLEDVGLDLLHISTTDAFQGQFGGQRSIGQWAKEITHLPIILAGGLGEPADAERAIADGHTDFAAIGSAMVSDPTWTESAGQRLL